MENNKTVSRRWHEAWGTKEINKAYAECLAPNFRAQFFGQGWVDWDTYIRRDQEFAAAFSETQIEVREIVAEGDTVMLRMVWRGAHTGTFQGIAPTGKRFEIGGFAVDRFRDGKIIEHIETRKKRVLGSHSFYFDIHSWIPPAKCCSPFIVQYPRPDLQ